MRDEDPESWNEAIAFDHAIRQADATGQINRRKLPFVHDTLVPLDQVDLAVEDGKIGAGCGIQGGLQGRFAGTCGV